MIAPILSPDGNFLWNGTEWTPNIQSHTQASQIIEPSSAELNPNDNWKMKFYAKRKIYSVILIFILLSSILTYFLFPEDETEYTFMPRGYAQDGSLYIFDTDFVEGENGITSGTMYFVTFRDWRGDENCSNPDPEKWIDSPNLDHVDSARFGAKCYWIPVENPNFIIFTVERQTDYVSKFCFNEGMGTCLFFAEYGLQDWGHSTVIDANNNCEILVRGAINYAEFEGGRSEWRDYHTLQFYEAKSNYWNKYSTGDKESDTYCSEYHLDGTGPLDQLLEQI